MATDRRKRVVVCALAAAWGCGAGQIGDRWEGFDAGGASTTGSTGSVGATSGGSSATGAATTGGSSVATTGGSGGGASTGTGTPPGTGGSSIGGSTDGGGGVGYCDVQQVLRARCVTCHANPPIAGAPMPLLTYGDLMAPARSDPTKTVAQVALARMQDAAKPMPPSPATRASSAEIGVVADWLAAGSPAACTSPPPEGGAGGPADASTGDGGVVGPTLDAGPPVVVCTSGRYWTGGNNGSSSMHPGGACITCHANQEDAPRFTIAGTVYPTLFEPIDCNGVNGGGVTQVIILGADGQTYTLQVNAVGNFYSTATIARPFRAKVVRNGLEHIMTVSQTTGNCNSCHTATGANGAPGRIMAP